MWKDILYIFGVIYFSEVKAQFCSCGSPIQQLLPIQEALSQIRPQITSVPVDSSVSNSLANALQLLIVSDVIASTINPRATMPPCMPTLTTIYDQLPSPLIYSPTDLIAPRTEFIPPSSVIELLRPQSCLESVVNISPVTNLGSNIYSLQEIISAYPNFGSTSPCLHEISPVPRTIGPSLSGGLTELISPVRNLGPVAELKYPQGSTLTLNVGSPSSIPCGNLNVEPIPYASVNYVY